MIKSISYFILAALAEIVGCFAFWAWVKNGKSSLWLPLGMISLAAFAYLLTRTEITLAGRAYAAYGGIYILASIGWLIIAEGTWPDRWDMMGVGLSLLGTLIILVGHLMK